MERGIYFKQEDGQIVHFDDVGNDKVDSRHTDSLKGVLWLDGKSIIGEAHSIENLVEHPIVLVFDSSVVRDASELVKYTLRQHAPGTVTINGMTRWLSHWSPQESKRQPKRKSWMVCLKIQYFMFNNLNFSGIS